MIKTIILAAMSLYFAATAVLAQSNTEELAPPSIFIGTEALEWMRITPKDKVLENISLTIPKSWVRDKYYWSDGDEKHPEIIFKVEAADLSEKERTGMEGGLKGYASKKQNINGILVEIITGELKQADAWYNVRMAIFEKPVLSGKQKLLVGLHALQTKKIDPIFDTILRSVRIDTKAKQALPGIASSQATNDIVPEPGMAQPIEPDDIVPEPDMAQPMQRDDVVPEPDMAQPVQPEPYIAQPRAVPPVRREYVAPESRVVAPQPRRVPPPEYEYEEPAPRAVNRMPRRGSSCDDLWVQRNQIYARKGYCFKSSRARAAFGRGCFSPYGRLSRKEKRRVASIKRRERNMGCSATNRRAAPPPPRNRRPRARGRSCNDLWYARNAIFARKGYCFKSKRGRRAFGRSCRPPYGKLNRSERSRVSAIKRQERRRGCR